LETRRKRKDVNNLKERKRKEKKGVIKEKNK